MNEKLNKISAMFVSRNGFFFFFWDTVKNLQDYALLASFILVSVIA